MAVRLDIGPSEAEQKQRPPRRGGRLWCLCKLPLRDGRPLSPIRIAKTHTPRISHILLETRAPLRNPDKPGQIPYP